MCLMWLMKGSGHEIYVSNQPLSRMALHLSLPKRKPLPELPESGFIINHDLISDDAHAHHAHARARALLP